MQLLDGHLWSAADGSHQRPWDEGRREGAPSRKAGKPPGGLEMDAPGPELGEGWEPALGDLDLPGLLLRPLPLELDPWAAKGANGGRDDHPTMSRHRG